MKVSISGVRGIFNDDLDLHEVVKFTKKFGSSAVKSGKCILARDTRPSGRVIADAVASSLMSSGIDVYDLGVAPTPAAFREARKTGSAMIVTASHNPLEWNGLKFVVDGRGLFEPELEAMLSSEPRPAARFGKTYPASTTYVSDIVSIAEQDGSGAPQAVGIDAGGGAACGYAETLFKELGYRVASINGIPGISSRGPDPTADELSDLRGVVTSGKLRFGFALDLDADRLVVVNSKGERLGPDATLLLSVARTMEMGMRTVVTSIDTSVAVDRYVKSHGGVVTHSKVGEANVVDKMLQEEADAGGEGSSAGFIMPKFNLCRDGLLAAATICTLGPGDFAECIQTASHYEQIRSKVAADSALHRRIIERLPDVLGKDASEVITIDGVKAIIDDNSWVLVRPSNTEHAIRVSVESTAGHAGALFKKASEQVQQVYAQIK